MAVLNSRGNRIRILAKTSIFILLLICGVFGGFLNVTNTSASVTLLYFRAIPEDGAVNLEWETATEIDSAGFYITRNLSQTGNYERIGSFIPSEGDSVVGAYYDYRDSSVENGVTYFYILESWDYDNTVDFSDPVSATPGETVQTTIPTITSTTTPTITSSPDVSPTPTHTSEPGLTPTITNTPTETSSPEPTQPNTAVPNPTSTPIPTNTPTSHVIDSPTPLPTATSDEVIHVTPSATLLPLPTIIIIYPSAERTAIPSPSPTPTLTQEPQEDYLKTYFRALGIVGLLCVIGILWVLLAIWIFLLLRRFSA